VFAHFSGGSPRGSVLLALSGKDGSELWRVNGCEVEGGAKMVTVDAKTRQEVSKYTDVNFGKTTVLFPDINGDGVADVATGHVELANRERKTAGRIYVFSGKDGSLLKTIFSPEANLPIGASIMPFVDRNFDDIPDILVGVPAASVDGKKGVGSILIMPM
jgi:hypothetical protein